MDAHQMAFRCPGAVLLGLGSIRGHEFRINRDGVATIVPSNRTVCGVMWNITSDHEASLDEYEGVAFGFYSKERLRVWLPDRGSVACLVYVAANSQAGRPRPGYLELIIAAASAHGLPPAYVAELGGWRGP